MNRKELKQKQRKVAEDFFEKFKGNFNVEELSRNGAGKFQYGRWYFEGCGQSDSISSFSIYINDRDSNHGRVYIHGSRRLMRKIKWFIIIEWNNRQETLEIQRSLSELEPIENQISKDFSSALDTYDALEN